MLLDTNAVSALLAGDARLGKILEAKSKHELPVIVIGEYRFGLLHSRHRKIIEPKFERLIMSSTVIAVDEATTISYAAIRAQLKKDGRPIPENDIWIAALAIQHNLHVLTRDVHFSFVAGLKTKTW